MPLYSILCICTDFYWSANTDFIHEWYCQQDISILQYEPVMIVTFFSIDIINPFIGWNLYSSAIILALKRQLIACTRDLSSLLDNYDGSHRQIAAHNGAGMVPLFQLNTRLPFKLYDEIEFTMKSTLERRLCQVLRVVLNTIQLV